MSSQGPPASVITPGYAFDTRTLRDASDWTQYKKRQMILNENKLKNFQDPWFVRGNQYRLDYLGGLFQNGTPTACAGCSSGAYYPNGPF